jgi:cell division protein ZipA
MQMLYALAIAILLVFLLRLAQWFRDYRRRLRIKLEPVPPGPDPDIVPNPELGKVRVRPRQEDVRFEPTVAAAPQDPPVTAAAAAAVFVEAAPVHDSAVQDTVSGAAVPESVPVLLTPASETQEVVAVEQHDLFADQPIAPPPLKKADLPPAASRASILYETQVVEPVRPVAPPPREKPLAAVEDVIAFHVVCREHAFNGEDLLRCVLSYGLRYGDMAIFHRHEQPTGQGRVLFSMAKAVEPGTFDLQAMTGEEVPGVSFFLGLPGVSSILAYDIMVDTAKRLATELQGEILDQQQQPLTRQLVEHYRERVQEFERRRLMNRPAS